MTHPSTHDEMPELLDRAREAAGAYLESLPDRLVRPKHAESIDGLDGDLPEDGDGALEAVRLLAEVGQANAIGSAGPRFFHFVVGGVTPAALAADWLTSTFDQNSGLYLGSPLGSRLETVALRWLRDLFALPSDWGGALVTGGTMANFTGLAAGRRWVGQQRGVDFDEEGLFGAEPIPVFTGGYVHASAVKALGMLGIGRSGIKTLAADDAGRLDLDALQREVARLEGRPAIVIANAGEVNTGDFDPLEGIVALKDEHQIWVHVDGAFGVFTRVSPRSSDLTAGIERADSVAADGHKWLNVPHDCGFVFVRDQELLTGVFGSRAAYYVGGGEDKPNWALAVPESSRRVRAFDVWATLKAYGRKGYQEMVERHLDLARHLGARLEAAEGFELLAPVRSNVVCFRYAPEGTEPEKLDELNQQLGQALLEDGRVYAGTTTYKGMVALRPTIVNHRTTEADIDLLVEVLIELAG